MNKLYIDPNKVSNKDGFEIIYESPDADYIVYDNIDEIDSSKNSGFKIKIRSKDDEELIAKASEKGAKFVIVEADDWKIIPLENIIARLNKSNTKIYTRADSADEVRTMFNVLELGVDGVILNSSDPSVIRSALAYLGNIKVKLMPVEIIEVREAGSGERVCVDTTSILKYGEGMLVGNRSNFLFLVHNESVG
ncbi:MAG: 3-dehydroquinate synthase, partial [Candidatus Nitrosothermus koennekii]